MKDMTDKAREILDEYRDHKDHNISDQLWQLAKSGVMGRIITCRHKPTGEDWVLLGVNFEQNNVCVAGWPPTMARLSDCENLCVDRPLSEDERKYRDREFGKNWI